jgi:uncharacterized protein YecE (DUF72 family)
LTRRARRGAAARTPFDRARLADAAEKVEKAAFTRADLIEIVGAQLPVDTEQSPRQRQVLEAAVDEIGMRLTAPRAAHQREGHERFTLDRILAEEKAVLDVVDARDDRSILWIKDEDTAGLSAEQKGRPEHRGLAVVGATALCASRCRQDDLDARARCDCAAIQPPPDRSGSDRQGRRRGCAGRRGR